MSRMRCLSTYYLYTAEDLSGYIISSEVGLDLSERDEDGTQLFNVEAVCNESEGYYGTPIVGYCEHSSIMYW